MGHCSHEGVGLIQKGWGLARVRVGLIQKGWGLARVRVGLRENSVSHCLSTKVGIGAGIDAEMNAIVGAESIQTLVCRSMLSGLSQMGARRLFSHI